jgi:DNA polymerase III subunit alpha
MTIPIAPAKPRLGFAHLHVHSHYSLLAGTAAVPDLVARAAAEAMAALALTDLNVLYGAVRFARACRAHQVQPIIGMTVTVAEPEEGLSQAPGPGRLVLLAMNPAGYRSLCRLSSLLQAGPNREFLSTHGVGWEELKLASDGLICLSGGRMGWVERYLRAGDFQAAGRYAARLGGIYGENGGLSVEIHRAADTAIAAEVWRLGQRFGLPVVAAQPVYCLEEADAPRLKLLAAIDRHCTLAEVPAAVLPANGAADVDLHWLTAVDITNRFETLPEAVSNVAAIVARCGAVLPDGRPIWPALKLAHDESPDDALRREAEAGLRERFGDDPPTAVPARLQKEVAAISQHGYAPLFLIVADLVRFARQHEIPVSTRGSVANSLVAYCTGITTVDPVAHDLLFERFLNPARANPPDIDLDFCSRRRDEVLAYIRDRYGPDRVALVATVSTMQPKSALRETAKVYGLDEETIKDLIRRLPQRWHPDPRRRDRRTVAEVIAEIADAQQREVMAVAFSLVDQPHHLSIHPGGVLITPGPLTDFVPVQWTSKGFLIAQFDHDDVEQLGLPKLDLLGIRALTVLADTAVAVHRQHDPEFRLEAIPLDDAYTGNLLARGDTIGVFQCESAGAQRTLRQLKARTVPDLAVANAFFKPGPALGGMAQRFIRRYRGEETVTDLHPALAPILGTTQGVLIFQEQILRLATEVAGLNWRQADHLRRGMSKFQAAEMATMRQQFVLGCQRPLPEGPALTAQQAETLWEQVLPFAGYGFNRGHATAYADVSYRSAYLKAHWPAEFLCARLADHGGFHHPAIYIAEAVRLGLTVRPPHINHSQAAFSLTYEPKQHKSRHVDVDRGDPALVPVLWMGLGQVRDLRQDTLRAILAARAQRPFGSLRDLLDRVSLQSKEAIHLIQCGALDGLGDSRAALLAEADQARRAGSSRQLAFAYAAPSVAVETAAERLAWEQHILGQPVSVHPLALVAGSLKESIPLLRLPQTRGRLVTVAGVRLPGWTGTQGFFLGDGQTFLIVKGDRSLKSPRPWQPLRLRGRWRSDEWDSVWFQAETVETIDLPISR